MERTTLVFNSPASKTETLEVYVVGRVVAVVRALWVNTYQSPAVWIASVTQCLMITLVRVSIYKVILVHKLSSYITNAHTRHCVIEPRGEEMPHDTTNPDEYHGEKLEERKNILA